MPFHGLRFIHIVKELDLKHESSLKNISFERNSIFQKPSNYIKFGNYITKGGNPFISISPGKAHAWPTDVYLSRSRATQDLTENESKKVCFLI